MVQNQSLSEEQKLAVSHWGSSARVIAGPGSGKTHSIAHRILYLVRQRHVPSSEIVVLTFTRVAAKELSDRLGEMGLSSDEIPHISTLHSYALKLLSAYPAHAGLNLPIHIADDYEESHIILPELAQITGKSKPEVTEAFQAYQATWNTLDAEHVDWGKVSFQSEFERALDSLASFYDFTLRGQLVFLLQKLLDENPSIAVELGVRHVLVDEYQDLNYCDQAAIEHLEASGATLYIVGDDDQSIYDFRHAYPEGIRRFVDTRSGAGHYELSSCYRCPPEILELGIKLISLETNRVEKRLTSTRSTGIAEIEAIQFANESEEARGIARICKLFVTDGEVSPKDVTILVSRNALAPPILHALLDEQLEATSLVSLWPLGGKGKGNEGGRQVYCLLRLVADRSDSLALRAWLGLQTGIGEKALTGVRSLGLKEGMTLPQTLEKLALQPDILPRVGNKIARQFERLNEILNRLDNCASTRETIENAINEVSSLDNDAKEELSEFFEYHIGITEDDSLKRLIASLSTFDLQAERTLDNDAVRIMTMHKAKGLSSKLVIIPGLEQDLLPGNMANDIARRLMYVAVTRSSKYLILTHAFRRHGATSYLGHGHGQPNKQRSIFLREMGLPRSNAGDKYLNDRQRHLIPAKTQVNYVPTPRSPKRATADQPTVVHVEEPYRLTSIDIQNIVAAMVALPEFNTVDGRTTLLGVAGVRDYLNINYEGPARTIAGNVVVSLSEFGLTRDGKLAIVLLLEYILGLAYLPQRHRVALNTIKSKLSQSTPS